MKDKARESVKRMAKKLEARESNGEDMEVIQPERSDSLDAHVAEFMDICEVNFLSPFSHSVAKTHADPRPKALLLHPARKGEILQSQRRLASTHSS